MIHLSRVPTQDPDTPRLPPPGIDTENNLPSAIRIRNVAANSRPLLTVLVL
jgi:hypothetical protein